MMTKELKALETIKNASTIYVGCASNIYTRYSHECKLIETALKDFEMEHILRVRLENINYELVREKQKNENKLKALEIIKELLNLKVIELLPNGSDTRLFVNCGDFKASVWIPSAYIDLLKEVLLEEGEKNGK